MKKVIVTIVLLFAFTSQVGAFSVSSFSSTPEIKSAQIERVGMYGITKWSCEDIGANPVYPLIATFYRCENR